VTTPAKGDLNGDGICSVADAVLMVRLLAEDADAAENLPPVHYPADINGDGILDLMDVRALLKMILAG